MPKGKKEKNITKQLKSDTDFDFETEDVIRMTNKNRMKKNEEQRKKISKEEKKRKKRLKRIKFILKTLVTLGVIIGGATFALISPIFNIKEIKVEGNTQVSNETVISLSGLATEENIFKFYSRAIKMKIKEIPYIENVKIHRKFPNTVLIKIEERIPTYAVEYVGSYAIINNQGYILETSQNNKNLPIIINSKTTESEITEGQRLVEEDLAKLETVLKIMSVAKDNNLDIKVTSIDIKNKNEYSIYLQEEQKTIHLGDSSNLSNKMLYVVAILEQEKEHPGDIYVNGDLNNKFKPYFREKV